MNEDEQARKRRDSGAERLLPCPSCRSTPKVKEMFDRGKAYWAFVACFNDKCKRKPFITGGSSLPNRQKPGGRKAVAIKAWNEWARVTDQS